MAEVFKLLWHIACVIRKSYNIFFNDISDTRNIWTVAHINMTQFRRRANKRYASWCLIRLGSSTFKTLLFLRILNVHHVILPFIKYNLTGTFRECSFNKKLYLMSFTNYVWLMFLEDLDSYQQLRSCSNCQARIDDEMGCLRAIYADRHSKEVCFDVHVCWSWLQN